MTVREEYRDEALVLLQVHIASQEKASQTMSTRYFFDLTYSSEDDNFWAQVFTRNGQEVYDTPVFSERKEVIADIRSKFPNAELLKEFS